MNYRSAGRKRFLAAILAGVFASGLFLGDVAVAQQAPPPAPEKTIQGTGAPAAAVLEVRYENKLLAVKAEKADLAALLKEVSEATGIAVEMGPEVTGTVSLSFAALKLEEGINRILEAADSKNYAATFEKVSEEKKDFRLQKISVVRKGNGDAKPAGSAVTASEWPRTSEGLRGYLKKKYGEVVGIRMTSWNETLNNVELLQYYESGSASNYSPPSA